MIYSEEKTPVYLRRTSTKNGNWIQRRTNVISVLNPGLIFSVVALLFFFLGKARADCNFQSVTDVNFGSYDVLSGLNDDSTGSITVSCSGSTWTTVTTSIGPSPNSGGFNPRQMKQTTGTDLLNYNLYTNSSRTTIWGDGTQGTSNVTTSIHKNHPWTGTIYGRIPSGQNVGIGNYGEILVITINF